MKVSDGSWRNTAVLSVMLIALTLASCSQHDGMPTSEETASQDQHLPFDGTSDKGGIFPTGSLTPTAIPAGTPLAVRLRTSLSSATSRPGDSFEAVLDEPIIVRGKMVAPSGANVTGKVLDARAANELQEPGYMRLALIAVSLNGQSVPIQTSSIFVKRGSHERRNLTSLSGSSSASMSGGSTSGSTSGAPMTLAGGLAGNSRGTLIGASTRPVPEMDTSYTTENKDVGFAPARRLTFRLAQPLPLGTEVR
jgi:hypothetical protein